MDESDSEAPTAGREAARYDRVLEQLAENPGADGDAPEDADGGDAADGHGGT